MTFSRISTSRMTNRTDRRAARGPGRILTLCATLLFSATVNGSEIDVSVLDRNGEGVADVAVYAVRVVGNEKLPPPASNSVMDQVDRRFVPHLLVVQTGTAVEFPNSDSVAHHVYSFSHPNKFMLPMYKGELHPPVTFDHSGVVSLGCNIHDHMLGYILVVDSSVFTKTDKNGRATLSVDDPEAYTINIWSPRLRDKTELLSRSLDSSSNPVTFSLGKKLNPPHHGPTDGNSWPDYQ